MTKELYNKYLIKSKTICRDIEQAKDLLHEVLLDLHTANTHYTYDSFIYVCLRNKYIKKHNRNVKHQAGMCQYKYTLEDTQPIDIRYDNELVCLDNAIKALPAKQQQVILDIMSDTPNVSNYDTFKANKRLALAKLRMSLTNAVK